MMRGREAKRPRRGFTLTEMLVVVAIISILLVILFVPLSRSLELTQRGNAEIQAQDNVRAAMRILSRDVANALEVLEPRPIAIWGHDAVPNRRNRPTVQGPPKAFVVQNGLILMRLPKRRYYCTQRDHYVTQSDIDAVFGAGAPYNDVALASCPRHPGSPIEVRPDTPLQPEKVITAYFVALKNPNRRDANNRPVYENILLFKQAILPADINTLNTYSLYRVEFDPRDPNFANIFDPDPSISANFFYDTRPAPNGITYSENWQLITRSIMDVETGDAVRWIETAGKFVPHSLCTVQPSSVQDETLQPNRTVGDYLLGGVLPSSVPALEYRADHGTWIDYATDSAGRRIGDGSFVIPDNLSMSNAGAGIRGPRIQIFDADAGGRLVFDTFQGNLAAESRERLITYDSLAGKVGTAIPRRDASFDPGTLERDNYQPNLTGYYTADLSEDITFDEHGMPASFGAAKNDRRFSATARIVPGSEVVMVAVVPPTYPAVPLQQVERLRRAGWSGVADALNTLVPQSELAMDEYTIDYRTGVVTFSDRDPAFWAGVGSGLGSPRRLLVRYEFQTNKATDIVRASYTTKELATVHLGVVQYTRTRQEILPFEVSERIVLRNVKR